MTRITRFLAACLAAVLLSVLAADAHAESPRAAWTTSRLNGTPEPPAPYKIVPAFPNVKFDHPTSLLEIPGAKRMLVTQRDGKVFTFAKRRAGSPQLAIDLGAVDCSALWSAALHPQFDENGYLYVCFVQDGDPKLTRVERYRLSGNPPRASVDSRQSIITWPAGGHNAGCLQFGTDGYLYISTGDGSGPNPPDGRTTGQDVTDLLGSILRIDVDGADGGQGYRIPADNPFTGQARTDGKPPRGEIWAYGLRNPWKFGVDPKTGDIYAADNGWETWELIHKIVRGGNCGWPVMEGRALLRSEVPVGPTPIIPPVKDHPHTEANSVIGGPVYRGAKLADLDGAFLYGDYITGTIWAVRPRGDDTYDHWTLVDTDQRIVAFCQGSQDEVYVLDYDFSGQIYELLPSGLEDLSADFPRRLSQTGLFESVEDLRPAPGVVPYRVKVQRWTDGAVAQRWIALPGRERASLGSILRPSEFPEGTVLVKQLSLPRGDREPLRLETQLLHYQYGSWHPYSYLWDAGGQDAKLVGSAGTDRTLSSEEAPDGHERTWHVSALNECRLCHNAGTQFVLGFVANQLDIADSGAASQLVRLAEQHVIGQRQPLAADDPARLVDPLDETRPLDDRARSYLHANCSMCHHPGGNAIVSFYLRRELPFSDLRTNKGTGIGTFGMQDAKLIVPGDPYRSVLTYRMSKLGYGRMPYIGSRVVDSQGLALIERWIREMPAADREELSAPLRGGTPEAQALATLGAADEAASSEAINRLVQSTSGALALIARMHGGAVPAPIVRAAAAQGSQQPSDRRGLFETFLPESQRRPTLGPNIKPLNILERDGNPALGKLIFFSDNARCRACHNTNDPAQSLGPTLLEIAKKYPRDSELLQHVLQPSLKIEDKFATYSVRTGDGQVLTGLLLEQTPKGIVLKTAEQKKYRLPRAKIEQMRKGEKSIMPDRILSDLTAQEAADLLAYILSLAPAGGDEPIASRGFF